MRGFLILVLIVLAVGATLFFMKDFKLPSSGGASKEATQPAPDASPAPTPTGVVVDITRAQARTPANGGSAVVLFTNQPAVADRNMVTCLNVWDVMDSATTSEIQVGLRKAADGTVEALRPLYWMGVAAMPAGEHTCAERMANYDYARAQTVRAKYGLNNAGPYLLVARSDEQAAATIDLTGMSDREIADMVRYFRDGFAYSGDIWDPARVTRQQTAMESFFGTRFRDSLVASLGFIASPAARAGCALGDLADAPCG